MLVKFLPNQITEHWAIIRHAIEVSCPPDVYTSPERLNNMLQAMLEGSMQCWVALEKREDNKAATLGLVVTTVTEDGCSGVRNLLVYAIYSYSEALIKPQTWVEGLKTLRTYAASLGCHRIIGYTNVDRIRNIVKTVLGGEAEYTFVSMPVSCGLP